MLVYFCPQFCKKQENEVPQRCPKWKDRKIRSFRDRWLFAKHAFRESRGGSPNIHKIQHFRDSRREPRKARKTVAFSKRKKGKNVPFESRRLVKNDVFRLRGQRMFYSKTRVLPDTCFTMFREEKTGPRMSFGGPKACILRALRSDPRLPRRLAKTKVFNAEIRTFVGRKNMLPPFHFEKTTNVSTKIVPLAGLHHSRKPRRASKGL